MSIWLLGMGLCAMAEATDVSSIENTVYVEPMTAEAGTQLTISVKMKNEVAITGYEFYVELPEGLSFATDEDDFLLTELSTKRTTPKKTSFFDSTVDESGDLHVLCSTTAEDPSTGMLYAFSGHDGEVCTIIINIPADMASGEYPIVMKNIVLTPPAADISYETERVEATLTVNGKGDSRTMLDETSTTMPSASDGAVDVRVRRTIVGGEWNTICLPFAMSEAQVKEAFGQECQLADFIGCEATEDDDENVVGITVHFASVKAIEANHPYFIKVTENVKEFTVDGVTIMPDEASVDMDEYTVGKGKTKQTYYNSFVGTYVADTTVPSLALVVSGNKFWYSTGKTKIGGYRAYFDFYTVLSDVENEYGEVKACFHDDATGIETVKDEGMSVKGEIYSLSGQRVARAQKGVYIINGKKILK